MRDEKFEKMFSSTWYEIFFMVPSLMMGGMVFFLIGIGLTDNLNCYVLVAVALSIITGIFSAFRKKILLQEEKLTQLKQKLDSLNDAS